MHGSSNRCSNQHYQKCDDNAFGECVGKAKEVNYVYEIVEGRQTGAYPGLRSMKRQGVFLLPPGWYTSPSQGYTQH